MSKISPRCLVWKGTTLTLNGKRAIISIVPDDKYSGMWRVKHPDGRLSDMVNRSRAKDAAWSAAFGILAGSQDRPQSRRGTPPIEFDDEGAP